MRRITAKICLNAIQKKKTLNGNGIYFKITTSGNTRATGDASSQVSQLWLAIPLKQVLVRHHSVITHCEDSQKYLWPQNLEKLKSEENESEILLLWVEKSIAPSFLLHISLCLQFLFISFILQMDLLMVKNNGSTCVCTNLCRTSVKQKDHLSDYVSFKL